MQLNVNRNQRKPVILQRTDEEGSQMWALSNSELSRVVGGDSDKDNLNTSTFTCERETGDCELDGTSNDD